MATLKDLSRGSLVRGIDPAGPVSIVDLKWHGSIAVEVFYKDEKGRPGSALLYEASEPRLEILTPEIHWSFDADGDLFKLVSEAHRIRLAYLFDPMLAVHTSRLTPLPHQITAVYEEMLKRQPLRFLLADDPGAGKTIMSGLLVKELIIRGDVERCLIVSPGNLVEQWQDEMWERFRLRFDIIGRELIETSYDRNPFRGRRYAVARLDMLARDEDLQKKLRLTAEEEREWDLIVVDEAHKMSAHYYGEEVKTTKRRRLGDLLRDLTRHFLLLTATPHNGKEEDFQLFMTLVDPDRFAGKERGKRKAADPSDLMRRLTKETLYKFDGKPLFPERKAYTVHYALSEAERELYEKVTDYVRTEMNRAEKIKAKQGRRAAVVGFALTVLQRRLASSPEAIYRSLERRRGRLENRREELRKIRDTVPQENDTERFLNLLDFDAEDFQDDWDETPSDELEDLEDEVIDQATAAQTIEELEKEIASLRELEILARQVRNSGTDRKWEQLSKILQDVPEMFEESGARRKIVIFSEHKDTVYYLSNRIRTLLGKQEPVVVIHGGIHRDLRRQVQTAFTSDKNVLVLVATDAAGEGINLQRAHLMVNYDLPWNPNRLEQRFGRIHRIGQRSVCHLWNLVARDTREGSVYTRLLEKLKAEKDALNGKVFDVLGKLFHEKSLKDLLMEAIRYGDDPEVKRRIDEVIDRSLDLETVKKIWEQNALCPETLNPAKVIEIREEMERMEARRLQPHFVSSFFIRAFRELGGTLRRREGRRYEISHVPAEVWRQDEDHIARRYERVAFHPEEVERPDSVKAEFLCPGHPLLDATVRLCIQRFGGLLKQGTVFVDPLDPGRTPRTLVYLSHAIEDALPTDGGRRRIVSERLQFLEMAPDASTVRAGYSPYLNYEVLDPSLREQLLEKREELLPGTDLEEASTAFAIEHLIPDHLKEVSDFRLALVEKTRRAVEKRLRREIAFWDRKAEERKARELAGKSPKKGHSSGVARRRAEDLQHRLEKRLHELDLQKQLLPCSPLLLGGALVIPQGLLDEMQGKAQPEPDTFAKETREVERLAVEAVMEAERKLGRRPRDVGAEKLGYDVESAVPDTGDLYFIEVKGRVAGAATVTVTKGEILYCLNKPDRFILAVVEVEDGKAREPLYVRNPFQREPDFGVASVNYKLNELLKRAEAPG